MKAFALAMAAAATVMTTSVATFSTVGVANAAPLCSDFGRAGILARCNRGDTIELTLASGKPVYEGEAVTLESGAYYKINITSDGTAELAISGAEFFRAVWLNEVVINEIEVRPLGLDSLEFDDEGSAEISFVAVKPGTYTLRIPGSTGESQGVSITIQ